MPRLHPSRRGVLPMHEPPRPVLRRVFGRHRHPEARCANGLSGIPRGLFGRSPRGRWYAFDPRNNIPRIGRLLMAYGRDAADVAISTIYGAAILAGFEVITDEIPD